MRKVILSIALSLTLTIALYACYETEHNNILKIDGIAVANDVNIEKKYNQLMVPLRPVVENLGAALDWDKDEVSIKKADRKATLKLDSKIAVIDNEAVSLSVKPYLKDNLMLVPLGFMEDFLDCQIHYGDSTLTIDTTPLRINGKNVTALKEEYHMTMGGVVQEIYGNAINTAIYQTIVENKGIKANAPTTYAWTPNLDIPGSYCKNGRYDFLDEQGNSVASYEIYSLLQAFPATTLAGYSKYLLYNVSENQWFEFEGSASISIEHYIHMASKHDLIKVISNTVA